MKKLALAYSSFAIALAAGAQASAQTAEAQGTVDITADADAGGAQPVNAAPNGGAPMSNGASDNALQLRDGSYVRGRVVDMRPGQYIVVVAANGQRTIAWTDILHAEGPSFPGGYTAASFGAPPPGVAMEAATDYLHPQAGRVPLVVESAGPALEISEWFAAEGGRRWRGTARPICTTPCTLYVERTTFALHARARGFRTVNENIDVPATGLRIRVQTTTNGRFYGAIGLLGGGGAVAVSGLTFMLYGAMLNGISYPYGSRSLGDGWVAAGAVVTGIGAAAVVAGAILLGTRADSSRASPRASDRHSFVACRGLARYRSYTLSSARRAVAWSVRAPAAQ